MVAALVLLAPCIFRPVPLDCRLHGVAFATGDPDGKFSKPKVGDELYWISVKYEINGGAARPFKVRFEMADLTYVDEVKNPSELEPDKIYTRSVGLSCPADGVITARVTLDPEGTSGDSDKTDKVSEIKFTPAPPPKAIEYYNPRRLRASLGATVEVGQRPVLVMHVFEGVPTTETSQEVLDLAAPSGVKTVRLPPFDMPFFDYRVVKPSSTVGIHHEFTIAASSVRVNRRLMGAVSWEEVDKSHDPYSLYVAPEKLVQSNDAGISAFVASVLPPDYRTKLCPAEAVRALFLAVAKSLTYDKSPGRPEDAVGTLERRAAACGGMSALFAACVRSIGVPIRVVSGWIEHPLEPDLGHAWTEFYLPGVGWIPADVTFCNGRHPKGDIAYFFGNIPDLNARCITTRGVTAVFPGEDGPSMASMAVFRSFGWSRPTAITFKFSLEQLK